jgi:hypothetical protein
MNGITISDLPLRDSGQLRFRAGPGMIRFKMVHEKKTHIQRLAGLTAISRGEQVVANP